MKHTQYNKIKLASWGQIQLSNHNLAIACDVMNLLAYWGDEYAEKIFNRLQDSIPEYYLEISQAC